MPPKKIKAKVITAEQEEQLIGFVQDKPFLYDLSRSDYKESLKKQNGWVAISQHMGFETADFWEKTWRGLRDQFNGYLRKLKLPTGSGRGKQPYFRHADAMKFYKDKDADDETIGNVDAENYSLTIVEPDDDGAPAMDTLMAGTEAHKTTGAKVNTKKRKLDPFEEQLINAVKHDAAGATSDEYSKFLQSLAPKLTRIGMKSKKKAAEVQLKIHQLIFEYESD